LVYFDEGRASYATGAPGSKQNPTEIALGHGKPLTMVGDNDVVLSVPTIESEHTMKVVWWNAI